MSPALKTLILPALMPLQTWTPFPPMIQAPSLEAIAISLSGPPAFTKNNVYLFSVLVMPNLKYLEVDGDVPISSTFGSDAFC